MLSNVCRPLDRASAKENLMAPAADVAIPSKAMAEEAPMFEITSYNHY